MHLISGATSPHKVDTGSINRPATAEPTTNSTLMPNGAPVRKATSQETLNNTKHSNSKLSEPAKPVDAGATTPKGSRRSSIAGRFFSAITD